MGVANLQSIQYSGRARASSSDRRLARARRGRDSSSTKYVASVNYAVPAMREETVRRDVDFPPRGGGAGPFNPATGQGGMRPIPGDVIQTSCETAHRRGLFQIWMTPHGFLKAAAANKVSISAPVGGARSVTVALGSGVRSPAYINDQNLVERVETRREQRPRRHAGRGDFSGYKDYGGVKFPSRIVQTQGGHPTLDLNVSDVRPNGARERSDCSGTSRRPRRLSAGEDRAREDRRRCLVPDGGAPMSVLVEFSDHVVIIEAPQDDERTRPRSRRSNSSCRRSRFATSSTRISTSIIRAAFAAMWPRAFPIITHEKNKPYLERILENPFTLEPDRLARSPRSPAIETVGEKRVLSDSTMTLELHHLQGNLHDETLLVAYLPKQKLLVQADAFHPRPGAEPLAHRRRSP